MCFSTSKAFCPLQLETFYRKCKNNLSSFLGQFSKVVFTWWALKIAQLCWTPYTYFSYYDVFCIPFYLLFHSIYTLVLFCVASGLGFMYYIILCLTKKYVNVLYASDRWVILHVCVSVKLQCMTVWSSLLGKTILYYFISTGGVRVDSAINFHHQLLSCRAMDTPMGQRMTHRDRPLWGESNSTMEDGWLARHTRGITNTGELWIIHCYTSSYGNICMHGF